MRKSTASLILTINTGSSSLKAAAYDVSSRLERKWQASITHIGSGTAELTVAGAGWEKKETKRIRAKDQAAALRAMMDRFGEFTEIESLLMIGHRIVHGGAKFTTACRISTRVLAQLEQLQRLAPDHMPQALEAIRFFRCEMKSVPQMAAFDTAFHIGMPEVARNYALAPSYARAGMHRFGFHGLSYSYIVDRLRHLEPHRQGKVIVAHLGSGASMAAIRDGQSVDTTMGFSPDSGLVMGTRVGDIDAALVLYLIEEKRRSANGVRVMLNHDAGLKAVSGRSADMQALLEHANTDMRSQQAIELFCYRAKHYLGAYAAILGGVDLLVFTGGIGEHSPQIRASICSNLEFLGIQLDRLANQKSAEIISSASSKVRVRVVPTDEDFVIAAEARKLLHRAKPAIP